MSADDVRRELRRMIAREVTAYMRDHAEQHVRGVVTAVTATTPVTLSARIDGAATPTPGVLVPSGMTVMAGDTVFVLRRPDGLLVVRDVLG